MRIWVGGILQESNTFSPKKASMDDFYSHIYFVGSELEKVTISNEFNGFRQAAAEVNAAYTPGFLCQAVSSGVFEKQSFEQLKELLRQQVKQAIGCDGVYFALHGAMVAEGCDDVEGELIHEIRQVIGSDIPLVISLDLHANVTQRMVGLVNGIVGYRTYPHIDFIETGYAAGKLLFSIVSKEKQPSIALRKIPMIVPAENSQTMRGPFADLWKEAEAGEQRGDSLATSLYPVQPWLDIEEMGSAIVVVGEDQARAEQEADRLAELFWNKRHEFDIKLVQVSDIVQLALREKGEGPFVISDSADSPGAGSTGDSNYVLRQLLELGVQDQLSCLLTMVDAPAVDKAIAAGVGQQVELTVGHTLSPGYGEPFTVTGIVSIIGDGNFYFQGGTVAKNTQGHMGRCVVLKIGRISVLLKEMAVFTGDPGMYRSVGLEPLQADIVLVKSANQFRADYEGISKHIYILDTPGSSTANLTSLTFHKLQKPFFPFEDNFNWKQAK
ncbi:M81 family metallopeptidase [Paenibacillus eucommiae]|uniref:Microcystin degradation protein MlrC n=1 Tax=Paenibacillus eucommiae TaxID=1355755 RepID=A0ABS4IR07_9BACL|nr:M81 family metallopeptidase [Paenibacillus eucommiae]MBP1989431.1 microcystin degradation protein MlrC [Paenibacillus eucommiae]